MSEWISVKDKIPEYCKDVLLTLWDEKKDKTYVMIGFFDDIDDYFDIDGKDEWVCIIYIPDLSIERDDLILKIDELKLNASHIVTHWSPLKEELI